MHLENVYSTSEYTFPLVASTYLHAGWYFHSWTQAESMKFALGCTLLEMFKVFVGHTNSQLSHCPGNLMPNVDMQV
jgi:hypothetical protein